MTLRRTSDELASLARLDGDRSAGAPEAGNPDALRVPARGRYDDAARRERLTWLRARTGAPLAALDAMRLAPERLGGNVENAIGAVEVPVGIAGPLLFAGEAARGVVHAPLATTEGALVASAARGATALTRAGGVRTRVTGKGMLRAPAFEFAGPREALAFGAWVVDQLGPLRERVREVSRHAELRRVEPAVVGATAHVVFSYGTGDAAGQNMTTATTWHACRWILERLPALGLAPRRFLIDGNMSGDKKVSLRLRGGPRGCAVVAECEVDEFTLERVLKVAPDELLAAWTTLRDGAHQVGMVAANVNVANIVAALFTATGQDIACVHESSVAELAITRTAEGIAARLVCPGIVLGTVGGGTHLPAQRALLESMGCTGPGSAERLAEIVAGFALALELSTLAALTTGEFATAHERLGRNRPVVPLSEEDLAPAFFEGGLRRHFGDAALRVERAEPIACGAGESILGEMAARRFGRAVGVFHRRLHHARGHTDVVVKVKPVDAEVRLAMGTLAASCGREVASAWARHAGETEFVGTHLRELAVYAERDPRFVRHVPAVYEILRDDRRETYALVLERLNGRVRLMDSADDPSGWGEREIEAALRGAGALHAIRLGRERELRSEPWIGPPRDAGRGVSMRPLWEALAEHAAAEFPALMPEAELRRQRSLLDRLPETWARIEAMPRTLVHNDFNPRNIALRDEGGALSLCAYDWELAAVDLPQHDVAELLAFVLSPSATRDEVSAWVELHRRAVIEAGAGDRVPGVAAWREGFALACRDLLVDRFGFYLMGHTARRYAFLPRALATLRRFLDLELERA